MYKTLKALYDSFYRPLAMEKAVQEISDAHRQLISHLDKADRKLVLQIIDAKDSIISASSLDSFICGFQLAISLINEVSLYTSGGAPIERATSPTLREEDN